MTGGELESLVRMANQIAANFSFHADPAERIADHFTRFWAPSMRKMLIAHEAAGGEGLQPEVREALGKLPPT
ncbi:MAG: formate dehydrogenase subunit delta [Xanthomonadales bacterium]|nr:formate dehydrogenase subunit delta [Xanthomonadales bacterium]NIN59793.1 formate dehydrogenase subunit delta [Xanthomonadales bacterium]NIN75168.1 formate dehydrogenase subunit delta [Xanthomonadales bacterium]NIO12754.1 formate dehydrogenase subunit delta [Xanthomonadales bacterium]NIP12186.1 formate dehydrogenase subunit delta [Xanthomonadales bacterium]